MKKTERGGRRGMAKSAVLGGVFALVMLGLLWVASARLSQHACEVCITYRGESACRKADGSTLEEARTTATDMACAVLASGMTDSLQCQRTEPRSVACDGNYPAGSGRKATP